MTKQEVKEGINNNQGIEKHFLWKILVVLGVCVMSIFKNMGITSCFFLFVLFLASHHSHWSVGSWS